MRERVKVIRYLGVLFLTILIFVIGIFLGSSVEELRVENLYNQLQEQDLEYQTVVTESTYIDFLVSSKEERGNISCDAIKGTYYTSIGNLDDARLKLENYINFGKVREDEFYRLREHYSNVQINYWILANRISSLCDSNMNTILYFYADKKKCPACEDQGIHLSYVKQRLGDDILIFAFDSQSSSGVLKLLSQRYSVSERELPVLVINNEIYGFMHNSLIFKILCEKGLDNEEVCNS